MSSNYPHFFIPLIARDMQKTSYDLEEYFMGKYLGRLASESTY